VCRQDWGSLSNRQTNLEDRDEVLQIRSRLGDLSSCIVCVKVKLEEWAIDCFRQKERRGVDISAASASKQCRFFSQAYTHCSSWLILASMIGDTIPWASITACSTAVRTAAERSTLRYVSDAYVTLLITE